MMLGIGSLFTLTAVFYCLSASPVTVVDIPSWFKKSCGTRYICDARTQYCDHVIYSCESCKDLCEVSARPLCERHCAVYLEYEERKSVTTPRPKEHITTSGQSTILSSSTETPHCEMSISTETILLIVIIILLIIVTILLIICLGPVAFIHGMKPCYKSLRSRKETAPNEMVVSIKATGGIPQGNSLNSAVSVLQSAEPAQCEAQPLLSPAIKVLSPSGEWAAQGLAVMRAGNVGAVGDCSEGRRNIEVVHNSVARNTGMGTLVATTNVVEGKETRPKRARSSGRFMTPVSGETVLLTSPQMCGKSSAIAEDANPQHHCSNRFTDDAGEIGSAIDEPFNVALFNQQPVPSSETDFLTSFKSNCLIDSDTSPQRRHKSNDLRSNGEHTI